MAALSGISLRLIHNVKSSLFTKTLSNINLQNFRISKNIIILQNVRVYSKNSTFEANNPVGKPPVVRKKTVPIQKILLLSQEGKVIQQLTIEEAQHLAKRRNFNLVKVVDVSIKSSLPIYQLMSKVQLFEEQNNSKQQKAYERNTLIKAAKDFIIASKIDKHDLEITINKITKLLKKHHKVQIYVSSGGQKATMEDIVQTIETSLSTDGKLKRKAATNSGMKLYFDPIIISETNEEKPSLHKTED